MPSLCCHFVPLVRLLHVHLQLSAAWQNCLCCILCLWPKDIQYHVWKCPFSFEHAQENSRGQRSISTQWSSRTTNTKHVFKVIAVDLLFPFISTVSTWHGEITASGPPRIPSSTPTAEPQYPLHVRTSHLKHTFSGWSIWYSKAQTYWAREQKAIWLGNHRAKLKELQILWGPFASCGGMLGHSKRVLMRWLTSH